MEAGVRPRISTRRGEEVDRSRVPVRRPFAACVVASRLPDDHRGSLKRDNVSKVVRTRQHHSRSASQPQPIQKERDQRCMPPRRRILNRRAEVLQ